MTEKVAEIPYSPEGEPLQIVVLIVVWMILCNRENSG